jgi:hypothetical protein
MRSMTLRCEINIHIYVRFAWTVSNCGRNHQQRIRPHGAVGYNTDLILHAPYSQGTGSESDIRGGKETQTGVLLTHTHTHGQPEHSDIDFSTLPAVGDSSLGHASRHIPIRTAL